MTKEIQFSILRFIKCVPAHAALLIRCMAFKLSTSQLSFHYLLPMVTVHYYRVTSLSPSFSTI